MYANTSGKLTLACRCRARYSGILEKHMLPKLTVLYIVNLTFVTSNLLYVFLCDRDL